MLKDLLLHPKTRTNCERYLHSPSQALLISGVMGSGKDSLSNALAAEILGVSENKLATYPYLLVIEPNDSTISIESVRSIQQFLRLKTSVISKGSYKRLVMIKNAEVMRREAQNALLKTLEEPPADTAFIMTAHNTTALLPTVLSRLQEIAILPVSLDAARKYFKSEKVDKYYPLSQGQAGLLHALLHSQAHPLIASVEKAKEILKTKPEARLLLSEELSKDKKSISMLLNALQRIAHAGLMSVAIKNNHAELKKWHHTLTNVAQSLEINQSNADTKLMLDNLFINL